MKNCRGCSGNVNQTNNNPYLKTNISEEIVEKTLKHPCYSPDAHNYARIHLPIAPLCNIQCKFCNRKYDCQNESRPGVTSNLLTPLQALKTFEYYYNNVENLSVMGIAGPGDALANVDRTFKTIDLIKEKYPEITVCLSTNGLMLPKYAIALRDIGVTHLTVTINAVDAHIGQQIYAHIDYERERIKGLKGAQILLDNQLKGLEMIKDMDMMCKVNIVAVKGINLDHIKQIVQKVKNLGVTYTNIMPLIPVSGTIFENHEVLTNAELNELRNECSEILPQMRHCRQCRADAVGKLSDTQTKIAI
jgi:nitrogenase cofactor biosynthesis protein NifB